MPTARHEKLTLSWRSRLFIHLHHFAVIALIAWVAILFVIGQAN